jgi:signal transduction histidine kinase/DNA-binding response OmpR family regulator
MRLSIKIYPRLKRIFFLFSVTLLLLELPSWNTSNIYGQNTGYKFFKNYTPEEYEGHNQNWAVLQDKRGIIFVANNIGLREFDGVTWRKIDVPNVTVRSMATDDTGTIYAGGKDEIGFLAPDSKGTLQYVSLLDHLDSNKKNFSDAWETHWTKQGIYYRTSNFLFRCDPVSKKIKVWEADNGFHIAFVCRGTLFIRQKNIGLMKIDKGSDSLKVVPGGETFAEKKIYMMAPYQNNSKKLLIGTRSKGFYLYDGIQAVPFTTGADSYLIEKKLSHGIRLSSGDFALATLHGGLVIIDSQGNLKEIFNKDYGLQDDNVKYVFEDSQGNLWLCLDKGISKIEYTSQVSIYDDRSNLPGNVQSVTRHNKNLYAGTTSGLFFLDSPHGFRLAAGITNNCWSLLSIEDSLLAATSDGVFKVENEKKKKVIKNRSYVLLHSRKDTNRVWVGTSRGLVSLYFKDGQWSGERYFENITQEIKTIVEDKKGNLWLGTRTQGVLKVDSPGNGTILNAVVSQYHTSHHLPAGPVRVFRAAGQVMFATDKGIFRFDENKKIFIPDSTLGKEFAGGSRGVFLIKEDKNKNIWLHSLSRNFQVKPQPDRTFVLNEKPFLRLPDIQVNEIYPDPGGNTTWFASNDGLIRYDTTVKKNYHCDFPTMIRKVLVNGEVIFDGYKYEKLFPVFEYKDRNLRFEFAAPFFEAETRTNYQCFLEGYDDNWSALTPETRKDYTNLDSGSYRFRVRAENIYENFSKEDVFQFKILPPWYKTWWAYTIYIIAGLLAISFVVKWRSGKLAREKQKLEQIVKQRTKEIEERTNEIKDKNLQLEKKTAQLEEQSEKLKEMDKVKSRFFANISHEFRTPLTLIMGPLEQVMSETRDSEHQKKLNLMLRNSQRLLGLINQLLELSKFESGTMKLQACQQNIIPFLKGIAASFDPVTTKNELDLTFQAEEEDIILYFDPGKLEEVLFNLLSNAVKFTPPGGKITVKVTKISTKEEDFPSGSVNITVSDTGPGIPRDQLAYIFDRFYQSDFTYEHHQKGSGIGLSIAKELVELHHGTIDVHSLEGKGTEFVIRLPLGDTHLGPEEIVEPPAKPYKHKTIPEIPSLYIKEKKPGIQEEVQEGQTDTITTKEDFVYLKPKKNIILLVEDSADFREYIRKALEPLYTVLETKDGLEGLQKAQEIIPDLIISDVMMPGMDGYELCRKLKKHITTCHIPVILLTAKASEDSIIHGLETGADDYITKPFNTKVLCARIKNLIDLRSHLQQTLKREMTLQPAKISVSNNDKKFIKNLKEVIDKDISNPDFNVTQMCKNLDMSQPTVYRKIYALSGESPTEFIRSYRLKRGAELLKENPAMTVLEVAMEVGFSSANYFSKCFKKMFHQLPSVYQASEAGKE